MSAPELQAENLALHAEVADLRQRLDQLEVQFASQQRITSAALDERQNALHSNKL